MRGVPKTWEEMVADVVEGRSYLHSQGYRLLYVPMHPSADVRGVVYEHRVVAEACHLGRLARRDEHVHHINEDKLDNRPENLAVLSSREHRGLHEAKVVTDAELKRLLMLGAVAAPLISAGVSTHRVARIRKELQLAGLDRFLRRVGQRGPTRRKVAA